MLRQILRGGLTAALRGGLTAGLTFVLVAASIVWIGPESVGASPATGAVYTLTNQVAGNQIAIFHRAPDGTLTPAGSMPTGGVGTGGGLGSQGAVILSHNNRWLFAVNAGSHTISSFAVTSHGLEPRGTVPSGGTRPISLTVWHNLLYVLNAGGAGNISGFAISPHGQLTALANSTRPLSGGATNPAQVQFSPNGQLLVVTEKATHRITTYVVDGDGRPAAPMAHPSVGSTPFGFAFNRHGYLIVSEAGQRAVSSYAVTAAGHVSPISSSVLTDQVAACWIAVSKDGRFAYTTNAGSGSITGYRITIDGGLERLGAGPTGVTGTGSGPTDMAFDESGRFLYVLEGGSHNLGAFATGPDGSLTAMPDAGVLPVGTVGIAAR